MIGFILAMAAVMFIARYTPGETGAPIPIMRTGTSVVGIFYLPAPDAAGGVFTIWQRLAAGGDRQVVVDWTEAGVR